MPDFTEYLIDRALSGDGFLSYDHAPGASDLDQATRRARQRDAMRSFIIVDPEDYLTEIEA